VAADEVLGGDGRFVGVTSAVAVLDLSRDGRPRPCGSPGKRTRSSAPVHALTEDGGASDAVPCN
jgi:hypothetical protein